MRAGRVGFLIIAGLSIADVFLPLTCAPSVDAACRAAEAAGTVSVVHQVHGVTGALQAVAITVVCLAIGWAMRDDDGWRAWAPLALGLGVVSGLLNLLYVVQEEWGVPGVGITVRAICTLVSVYLVVFAVALVRAGGSAPSTPVALPPRA